MKETSNISHRIPVTIITGFLGSGKTTFLNNMLKKHPQKRFAIVENEFGELGIDGDLLQYEKTPVYELVNGCICCSLNHDFYHALQTIIEEHKNIDHLLVETTGIADPIHVIDLFGANEIIQKNFILDSVICLTDSSNLEHIIAMEPEARKQIALSDTVLLNKMDLIAHTKAGMLKNMIGSINPMAEIIETSHAQTNGSPMLGTKAYSLPHIEASTISFHNINLSLKSIALNGHTLKNELHTHDIHAEGFIFDECTDPELFNIWISSMMYFHQNSLYRVKGILNLQNKNKRYIFQAVKGVCVFEEGTCWKEGEDRFSKIVFIGKHLDRRELEIKLAKLFKAKISAKIS